MATLRPPNNEPPIDGDQHGPAWTAFFGDLARVVADHAAFVASVAALPTAASYANDAAAAAGGVAVGGLYRNGSAVMVRVT